MEDTTVTDPTEVEVEIAAIAQSILTTFESLFPLVFSTDWQRFTLNEAKQFRNLIEQYFASASILREEFDKQVWKGHADGTVDTEIESIRKQREGDAPGRKKKELTPAEILAKRLGK